MFYVNLYETNKAFGGPEEGGWWFDVGEPVRSFAFFTRRKAERCLRAVQKIADCRNTNEQRHAPSSVLCDGWYQAWIEDAPARAYPAARPHYE